MAQIVEYGIQNLPGAPLVLPPGLPRLRYVTNTGDRIHNPSQVSIPGEGLKRGLTYLADYGGCGFYRCIGPNLLLNLYEKAVIAECTTMVLDPRFYQTFTAVKMQRQATPYQLEFVKLLKEISKQTELKLIYEVDDVVLAEDIPLYNKNRDAFTDPVVRKSIIEILSMVDEITVTSEYFRDYIIEKTGRECVTSVPNYLMKWWFDRYYDLGKLVKNFEKNKKKPIIAIFASGTHVDVTNKVNQKDDFETVLPAIIKTRTDFTWHFYGSYPLGIKPFIDSGEIKYTPWVKLPDYASALGTCGAQVTFAALQDNFFNRCKSNIKQLESGAVGIPCVCPDMVTYKDADLKYKTEDEFIDCIKHVTKNQTIYADYCKKARAYTERFWLDDEVNLMKHHEVFFTPFGSKERKFLKG